MRAAARLAMVGACLLAWAPAAQAGGYDTPILYTARHMGMGGTAISYVDDPSALFHNPAGIGRTKFATVLGDLSLLLGNVTACPDENDVSVKSELTVSPAFLIGVTVRPLRTVLEDNDFLGIGFAVYPVAAAGATFKYVSRYSTNGKSWDDSTTLRFFELSPGLSLHLPESIAKDFGYLSIGFGYRIIYASLDRFKGASDGSYDFLSLSLSGFNFEGFRIGLQFSLFEYLDFGLTYRHKTRTEITGDSSVLFTIDHNATSMPLILPSKLGFGLRGNFGPISLAADLEYGFYSQNERDNIVAEQKNSTSTTPLPSVNEWQDAITFRFGAEVSFLEDGRLRMGYILDEKVANEDYPTAFGTPPGRTHSVTIGGGYVSGPWSVNLAYAYRHGAAETGEAPLPSDCPACGKAGRYEIDLHGVYVDLSYEFDVP